MVATLGAVLAGCIMGLIGLAAESDPLRVLGSAATISALTLAGVHLYRWANRRAGPQGVLGWDSVVTEIKQTESTPAKLLLFRLYGPEGHPAGGEVSCEVTFRGRSYSPKEGRLRFNDYNLHPGELAHYAAFYPESFGKAPRGNGDYVLMWEEAHGLSTRLLDFHRFTVENGKLKGAKPERWD